MGNHNKLPDGTPVVYPARYQLQIRTVTQDRWLQEGPGSNHLLLMQRRCQFRRKWAGSGKLHFRVWDRITCEEVPVP